MSQFIGPTVWNIPVYVSRCVKCPSLWVTLYEMSQFMGHTVWNIPVYGFHCMKCPSFMGRTLWDVPVYWSHCMKCPSLCVPLYEMSQFMCPTVWNVPVYGSHCLKCPSLWVSLHEMSQFYRSYCPIAYCMEIHSLWVPLFEMSQLRTPSYKVSQYRICYTCISYWISLSILCHSLFFIQMIVSSLHSSYTYIRLLGDYPSY